MSKADRYYKIIAFMAVVLFSAGITVVSADSHPPAGEPGTGPGESGTGPGESGPGPGSGGVRSGDGGVPRGMAVVER